MLAETEWRDIMVPIREKLARSKQPFNFEGVAIVLRKPDLIMGFHKWATAKNVCDFLPVEKQAELAQNLVDKQHEHEHEHERESGLWWGEMKARAVGMLLDVKAAQRKVIVRARLVAEDARASLSAPTRSMTIGAR